MGYRLNHLDEPVFMAVPKPMQTEFGIHSRSESCDIFGAGKSTSMKLLRNCLTAKDCILNRMSINKISALMISWRS